MTGFLFFRITSLQDVHRAHQREYEKYVEDVESSKMTVQELEKSSDAALNYKFYRAMKTYVENLINCLNEKVGISSSSLFFFFLDDKGAFCQQKIRVFCLEMMRETTQLKISSIRNVNVTRNKI